MIFRNFGWAIILSISLFEILGVSCVHADSFDVRISSGMDDVEETVSDGDMYTNSSDMELVYDGHDQIVGLRFLNVSIPPTATITEAYIEFETDDTYNRNPCNLLIHGQAHNNAPAFSTSPRNISDRTPTNSSVTWSPPDWNQKDEKHRTPNLAAIIQEIIKIPGWNSGNAMVFVIVGEGRRSAESFEEEPANAALLHIEYDLGPKFQIEPSNIETTTNLGENAASQTFSITNSGISFGILPQAHQANNSCKNSRNN